MNLKEKAITLAELLLLIISSTKISLAPEHSMSWLAWTAVAAFSSIGLFISIYSDLKHRNFLNPNAKMQWMASMLIFPPLVIIYLFGMAFKPRD